MSRELSDNRGKRKYLIDIELDQFLDAASNLERADIRTFCMTLAYTGCRISEALALTVDRVDLSAKTVTFRTLKQGTHKNGKLKGEQKTIYRSVPVPDHYIDALKMVHQIKKIQRRKCGGEESRLWPFTRSTGSLYVSEVMKTAGITGLHASAKGLRHGFGVRLAQKTRNPRLVQKLLGHRSLETTAIYMDLVGEEERAEVMAVW